MSYNIDRYKLDVTNHYLNNWGSKFIEKTKFNGPINNTVPHFSILVYEPSPSRNMWTYATCGMSTYSHLLPIEIHLYSSIEDDSIFEILCAVCYYHNIESNLNLGHTVNFGRPWQGESKSSFGLLSLPYLDGPSLEILRKENGMDVNFYWLIPITKNEVDYKLVRGLDALELKFEEHQFNYLDPYRNEVI